MGYGEFDEATIITLMPGDEPLRVSTFEEAFEGHDNLFGKKHQEKKQARQVAKQQRKQAKVAAKAQTKAMKQQAKVAKKVGRQQVKAQKHVAKQQAKTAKKVARQDKKTAKVAARQDRKDMRVQRRTDRQALKGGPELEEELLDDTLDDTAAQEGAEELQEGTPPSAEEQDYAEQSNPESDAGVEADTEAEADMSNEEEGESEGEDEAGSEDDWAEGDYEEDGDVDETEYGFNGDMDAASCFDAGVRQPDPRVMDPVKRIERNKFKIFCLEKKMNADGGDQLAMQREVNQRKDRIEQLLEQVKGYFSEAKGGKRVEKKAAKAEVKAAKKQAKRELKQEVQAQRAANKAAKPASGPLLKRHTQASRPAAPATTPVAESLDPSIGENQVDIPAEQGEVVENFSGNKQEGIIARDGVHDYDAPKPRVFELHSNASGPNGVSAAKVVTFIGIAAVAIYFGHKL